MGFFFFFSTSSDSTYCTRILKKYSAPVGSEKSGELKDVCYCLLLAHRRPFVRVASAVVAVVAV